MSQHHLLLPQYCHLHKGKLSHYHLSVPTTSPPTTGPQTPTCASFYSTNCTITPTTLINRANNIQQKEINSHETQMMTQFVVFVWVANSAQSGSNKQVVPTNTKADQRIPVKLRLTPVPPVATSLLSVQMRQKLTGWDFSWCSWQWYLMFMLHLSQLL